TAYDLWGLGGSGRVMINYRNNAYNFRFELTNVNLGAAAKLVTGKSDYDLSPSSFSFTAAYLFDVF
ncbi:MAG: hypothetical protein OEX00_01990, partial [Gammaproteobacteria bacterium]|nr:hypothetical protein [Gammaproteobacteria bacterium]